MSLFLEEEARDRYIKALDVAINHAKPGGDLAKELANIRNALRKVAVTREWNGTSPLQCGHKVQQGVIPTVLVDGAQIFTPTGKIEFKHRENIEPLKPSVAKMLTGYFDDHSVAYSGDFKNKVVGLVKHLQDEGLIEVVKK